MQLHALKGCVGAAIALSWASIFLLRDKMTAPMSAMYASSWVSLFLVLFKGWSLRNYLSTMTRNFLPRLFLTLQSYGGLCHVIFFSLIFALSRYLPSLRIEFKLVVVATFFKRVLVWADSFMKDLIVLRDVFQQCRGMFTQTVNIQ